MTIKEIPGTVTGYKATNKDMKCFGYQFELGKWHEHDGAIVMCQSGFHFCPQHSGTWAYRNSDGTRIFKVEADGVMGDLDEPGSDVKYVARRIRFVEEINCKGDDGHCNTGNRNTGYCNTGYRNTGDRNTGDWNTGHRNTGDCNTGYRNTGNRNTGDCNTGYRNTGYCNTGDRNTGHRNTGYDNTGDCNTGHRNTGYDNTGYYNTGDCNTGDCNTGDRNTGDGNATNKCTGYFCKENQPLVFFDEPYAGDENDIDWNVIDLLVIKLCYNDEFDYYTKKWLRVPNATPEKIKALHDVHIARRKEACDGSK